MPYLRQGIGQGYDDAARYPFDLPFSGFLFLPVIAANAN